MSYRLLEKNSLVFLDILKKNNVDNHFIKTIELINSLIKKSYVSESYCLIRMLFEEIMYDLAVKINPKFSLTIRTSPSKIRNFVTQNREEIFGDLYEENYFDSIYEYLSKMTHITALRKYVSDIIENKTIKKFMKENQMNIFLTVIHILVVSTSSNLELIELSNYIVYASCKLLLNRTMELDNNVSSNTIKKYSGVFHDEKDKEYLKNKTNETKELFESLDTVEIINKQKIAAVRVKDLIKKYGYDKIYD